MIIDAHQHFWDPKRCDYDWLTADMELCRAFEPSDLEPLLRDNGVDATILVQAAPTKAESDYLLGIARETNWVAGVVGWVDLAAPDAATAVAKRASDDHFVGVRPMLQNLAERGWILRPEVQPGLEAVAETGLVFDALIRHDQLPFVPRLAERHPSLIIVIDHAAKPPFGQAEAMRDWTRHLAEAAAYPRVHCKLSGLLTELPPGADESEVRECISYLFRQFGTDRLIWGSDWPVLTLRGNYGDWLGLCRSELARFGSAACDAVFGGNAGRLYRALIPAEEHSNGQA